MPMSSKQTDAYQAASVAFIAQNQFRVGPCFPCSTLSVWCCVFRQHVGGRYQELVSHPSANNFLLMLHWADLYVGTTGSANEAAAIAATLSSLHYLPCSARCCAADMIFFPSRVCFGCLMLCSIAPTHFAYNREKYPRA